MPGTLFRLSAFTTTAAGGNPAGVWIGDAFPAASTMQQIAEEVGYSETAFVVPTRGMEREVRYFSPEAEISFCGHATIAAGVMLGEQCGDGTYHLATSVGRVPVVTRLREGQREASLTSVVPRHELASTTLVRSVLAALHWSAAELEPAIPPARAYAGAWHLVLAARTHERLNDLEYEFDDLKAIMLDEGLTTIQLVWRESQTVFRARNPFPVGGVIEDPATGAAAAALGGYLRDSGLIAAPTEFVVFQGEALGRPSRIMVDVPASGGIVVSGTAVVLPDEP